MSSPHLSSAAKRVRLATLLAAPLLALTCRAQFTIMNGTGNYNANTAGTHTLAAGDSRTIASGGTEVISVGAASGTFTLQIDGTVAQNGSGRGIRTSTNNVTFNLNVGATGKVSAIGDDAFQARNGTVNLVNFGTLYSGPNLAATPSSPVVTGRGFNARDAAGGTGLNEVGGLIRADGGDAVRVGSNFSFINRGTILAAGVVNDASSNNSFNSAPNNSVAENFSAGGGFSFEDASGSVGAKNSSLTNSGTITGARHGVQAGTLGSNLTVTNEASGLIVGRNGSGVGFDTTEIDPTKIVINNSGTIRGDYAGSGNVIDRTGSASFTQDGDGDGVDIDGAATINNYAGGKILATGAGGFDSGGRANSSDGISIGGGVINNAGLIQGATVGIVVNNDTNVGRSGVAATTITNSNTGSIIGQNGYAIRLENKLSDARDDDTIINDGTIIGGGAIPASGVITLQNGAVDTNSSGNLDGASYSGTGNARFIKGDGSAIQMGEGKDKLVNSGTITGLNGRALNMEGGDDLVTIKGGAVNGAMNGGSGFDTLTFDVGSGQFLQNGAIANFEKIDLVSGKTTLGGLLDLGAKSNALTVMSGATLYVAPPSLTIENGSLVVDGGLRFSLLGDANYSKLVFGADNLGGLDLGLASILSLDLGYKPVIGQQFTLIDFLGTGKFLTGSFAGLAEGSSFAVDGVHFIISYVGNDGNDVVITRTVPDAGSTLALLAGTFGLLVLGARRKARAA